MIILNDLITVLVALSVVGGISAICVGVWAIITRREKLYKEKSKQFKDQLNRVEKDIKRRRDNNEK